IIKIILGYLHPISPFVSYYIYKNLFNEKIIDINLNNLVNELEKKVNELDNPESIKVIDNLIELIKFVRPYVNDLIFVSKQNNLKIDEILLYFENFEKFYKSEYIIDLLNIFSIFIKSKILNLLNIKSNAEDRYYDLYYNGILIRIYIQKDLVDFYRNYILKELENKIKQKEKIEKLLNNSEFMNRANIEVINNYKNELEQINEIVNKNKQILNLLKK
ncbi:MAG: hypothetical protein ACPL1F_04090, partial [bacterium]